MLSLYLLSPACLHFGQSSGPLPTRDGYFSLPGHPRSRCVYTCLFSQLLNKWHHFVYLVCVSTPNVCFVHDQTVD